jgi:hypothetical protein
MESPRHVAVRCSRWPSMMPMVNVCLNPW